MQKGRDGDEKGLVAMKNKSEKTCVAEIQNRRVVIDVTAATMLQRSVIFLRAKTDSLEFRIM